MYSVLGYVRWFILFSFLFTCLRTLQYDFQQSKGYKKANLHRVAKSFWVEKKKLNFSEICYLILL